MRYSVLEVDDSTFTDSKWTPWPLQVPVDQVANKLADRANPEWKPAVHLADGDNATQLRALRKRLWDGEFGLAENKFIPISADGKHYLLFAADSHPLENSSGVMPFAFR